jgi:hypothetical protein
VSIHTVNVVARSLLLGFVLTGFFVPFALVLLAPVVVNIFAFHAFLDPGNIALGIVLGVLEAYLAWYYREAFLPLFRTPARAR